MDILSCRTNRRAKFEKDLHTHMYILDLACVYCVKSDELTKSVMIKATTDLNLREH